eukprot:85668_1
METIRNRIITEHACLVEQLEFKYMNYIQQLLVQKSQIIVKMQRDFYRQLHALNTLPIDINASDKYHIGIPPMITSQTKQTDDLSPRNDSDHESDTYLDVTSTESNSPVILSQSIESEDRNQIHCKDISPPGTTKKTPVLQTYNSPSNKPQSKLLSKTHNRFKCAYCNKTFKLRNNLKEHIRIHTGKRPFKCNHPGCDYAAARNFTLTRHIRTHTGEKPYKCNHPTCDYAAIQKHTLSRHIINIHSGVKSFQCNNCHKRFTTAKRKRKHVNKASCKKRHHKK